MKDFACQPITVKGTLKDILSSGGQAVLATYDHGELVVHDRLLPPGHLIPSGTRAIACRHRKDYVVVSFAGCSVGG